MLSILQWGCLSPSYLIFFLKISLVQIKLSSWWLYKHVFLAAVQKSFSRLSFCICSSKEFLMDSPVNTNKKGLQCFGKYLLRAHSIYLHFLKVDMLFPGLQDLLSATFWNRRESTPEVRPCLIMEFRQG